MLDQQLINEIKSALDPAVPFLFFICDTSGRVVTSNAVGETGTMNLDAITAINEDRKVLSPPRGAVRRSAVPLRHDGRFVGALVVRGDHAETTVDILKATIELLYSEKIQAKNTIKQTQLKDRFQQLWFQKRDGYDRDFIEQGRRLGIDITPNHQVLLIDEPPDTQPQPRSPQRLIDAHDFILTDVTPFKCVILRENSLLQQKINRLLTVYKDCDIGIGSLGNHLHTSHTQALQSLKIGKALFPRQKCHRHDQLQIAITIAETGMNRRLSRTFALLMEKGHTARLAQTVVAFLQHNGNVTDVCDALHIHRNSIQYRLNKIKKICGLDLKNYYDMLHLYASYISYLLEHGPIE